MFEVPSLPRRARSSSAVRRGRASSRALAMLSRTRAGRLVDPCLRSVFQNVRPSPAAPRSRLAVRKRAPQTPAWPHQSHCSLDRIADNAARHRRIRPTNLGASSAPSPAPSSASRRVPTSPRPRPPLLRATAKPRPRTSCLLPTHARFDRNRHDRPTSESRLESPANSNPAPATARECPRLVSRPRFLPTPALPPLSPPATMRPRQRPAREHHSTARPAAGDGASPCFHLRRHSHTAISLSSFRIPPAHLSLSRSPSPSHHISLANGRLQTAGGMSKLIDPCHKHDAKAPTHSRRPQTPPACARNQRPTPTRCRLQHTWISPWRPSAVVCSGIWQRERRGMVCGGEGYRSATRGATGTQVPPQRGRVVCGVARTARAGGVGESGAPGAGERRVEAERPCCGAVVPHPACLPALL